MTRGFTVGLALGGGGARGLAHLGVLKALEAGNISFDRISGSSFGSIVGAMYAQDPHFENIYAKVCRTLGSRAFRKTKIFFIKKHYEQKKQQNLLTTIKSYLKEGFFWGISLQRPSFIPEEDLVTHIAALIDDGQIEDTPISFVSVTTDFNRGTPVVLAAGPVRRAVAASCAIPGVFPPIQIGSLLLIDGGWVSPIPVGPLVESETDFIIAVDTTEEAVPSHPHETGLDIVLRANAITRRVLSATQLAQADFVIRPKIEKLHWSNFWQYEEAMARGEEATMEQLSALKRAIWKKKFRKRFGLK